MTEFFDDAEYRQRIHHHDNISVTESSLESMHRSQVFTLPFENLDIHLGRGIQVDPEAIYNKVVKKPRGGYCFELNGTQWIADVGFGAASLHTPLPFELDRIDKQDGQEYRLKAVKPWGNMLQLKVKDDGMNLYRFDMEHVCQSDIETGKATQNELAEGATYIDDLISIFGIQLDADFEDFKV